MDNSEPRNAEPIAVDATTALSWDEARSRLAERIFFWFATPRPDGHPHVRPVLTVVVDGTLYTTTSPTARKGKNLERDPRCSIAAATDGLDLVVEGTATKVTDASTLHRVADAYKSKYEWPAAVVDRAFDAPYGAPTAGAPPYEVYEITPVVAYGFGTNETLAPRSTRWEF
jgi:nitroimidazol reductase NimA-like FMN-containing flavoprotein (pyridoxamine 5'-phosphate oxidase superfamily)